MRAREKPHLRCKGGVWSCAQYLEVPYAGMFQIYWKLGLGHSWREAWNDYLAQEFA